MKICVEISGISARNYAGKSKDAFSKKAVQARKCRWDDHVKSERHKWFKKRYLVKHKHDNMAMRQLIEDGGNTLQHLET